MQDGALRKRGPAAGWALLVVLSLLRLLLGAAVSVGAQGATAETSLQTGQVVTAHLDYQELDYSYINLGIKVTARSEPFRLEPALGAGRLTRGLLQLGGALTNKMAFGFDRSGRRLYLDLNRNLDLTDDPAGVLTCRSGWQGSYQMFTNVHLPFKTSVGERPALVDLMIYDYQSLECAAAMRSLWQGKVALQGEEWQVGFLPDPFGQRSPADSGGLLLRPWNERHRTFRQYGGALEAFPFSRKLFFGQVAYEVRCTNEVQGDSAQMRLEFAEERPKLGELRITGESVERVTLEGGPYRVVLSKPEAVTKVPVGYYASAKVCLRKDDVEACLDDQEQRSKQVMVSEQAPAVLTAGGPLTNSVAVSRRGKDLSLSYQLVGAGGVYQMMKQDRTHPPEFTVYRGDKKLASGKFQFG